MKKSRRPILAKYVKTRDKSIKEIQVSIEKIINNKQNQKLICYNIYFFKKIIISKIFIPKKIRFKRTRN